MVPGATYRHGVCLEESRGLVEQVQGVSELERHVGQPHLLVRRARRIRPHGHDRQVVEWFVPAEKNTMRPGKRPTSFSPSTPE